MRRTAEELANMIKNIVGEDNNSDEVIELMEDVSDSVTDETEYTKEKFDELDRTWRERYTKRFMGEVSENREEETPAENDEKVEEDISIEDLFEDKE